MVSLHLYDDEGRLLITPNHIPMYVDFAASESRVWKAASEAGYLQRIALDRTSS